MLDNKQQKISDYKYFSSELSKATIDNETNSKLENSSKSITNLVSENKLDIFDKSIRRRSSLHFDDKSFDMLLLSKFDNLTIS